MKHSASILAVLNAVEKSAASHRAISTLVETELANHTLMDDERFKQLTVLVESIAVDVKSLLATRSFTRGVMRTAAVTSTAFSTIIGLLFGAFKLWKG
jgi:predicted component of type VI protein secretion system